MKILITTFTYPPNADGVAEATAALANGLAKRAHTITVATAFHPDRPPNTPAPDPRVEQFKISGGTKPRTVFPGEFRRYQEFLRNFDCDAIIFENWDCWCTSLALPVFREISARKVLVSHGFTPHIWISYRKPFWGLGPWLRGLPLVVRMPFLMRRFDHVIFLSRRAAWDRFLDHWVARATGFRRFSVIPNGAFAREFADASIDFRAAYKIGPGPMLLCVANYCDRKNQLMALRAFREAGLKNATLVFVGSEFNEYSRQMERLDAELAARSPDGRVLLLEKVGRQMTCAAFRAADLFVLSAKAETQPIVLLEALASRTPFVSTNVGCVSEIPGGIVVDSERDLALRMKMLSESPERRRELAEQGWTAVQTTYDWNRVIAAYEALLRKITGENIRPLVSQSQ